ncbi:MAG: MaoC family dehydratase N-terminal domain-containing protein [Acidimicrobiia bacterium]|nr:MaoC family dehydratase N-terminal domain-containing protein [Acidimicrobiia bacterium]
MAAERFPIEYGHVLMFARSIGDTNPIYSDEEYAKSTEVGGIIAPPTFVQASAQFNPDYGLRPHPDRPWHGSGKEPSGLRRPAPTSDGAAEGGGAKSDDAPTPPRGGGGSGLHAEQHYEYHRPLRVGDVLTATTRPGDTWEKEGRRAGKLVFSESVTEYRDEAGELVVTARSVGVRTERPVES